MIIQLAATQYLHHRIPKVQIGQICTFGIFVFRKLEQIVGGHAVILCKRDNCCLPLQLNGREVVVLRLNSRELFPSELVSTLEIIKIQNVRSPQTRYGERA